MFLFVQVYNIFAFLPAGLVVLPAGSFFVLDLLLAKLYTIYYRSDGKLEYREDKYFEVWDGSPDRN